MTIGGMDAAANRNVHGRRWGRGARPYLIVLKLACVAACAGGLMTLLAVSAGGEPDDAAAWIARAELARSVYLRVIVPGAAGAMTLGVLLTASMVGTMIRMRWFVTKVGLIVVCVPALHLFARSRLLALHAALAQPSPDLAVVAGLWIRTMGVTSAALGFVLVVIVLGRVKPRLGQDYGRTLARAKPRSTGIA